jgi:hypothetical protein
MGVGFRLNPTRESFNERLIDSRGSIEKPRARKRDTSWFKRHYREQAKIEREQRR